MTTASEVLALASSQVGYVERSGNRTKFNEWFYGSDLGAPWCHIFASWVFEHVGAGSLAPKTAYTPTGANWFRNKGAWATSEARPGDVAYFYAPDLRRIGHVEIVESVMADGHLVTIGGNTNQAGSRTGGMVARMHRAPAGDRPGLHIVGYGRPAYSGTTVLNHYVEALKEAKLRVDGDFGRLSVTRLQQSLNRTGANPRLAEDGDFGPKSKRALQARLNHTNGPVDIDGDVGPQTVRALQRNVGVRPDGDWGPKTTAALQATLNTREL